MANRLHVTVFLLVASAVWAVALIARGVPFTARFFEPFSLVVGACVLALTLFEVWIWRWPFLHPWFVHVPNVRGTWKGEIASLWVDPETGARPAAIPCFISIRQSFSSIQIRLMTSESSSNLLSGSLAAASDGTFELTGVYRNTPRLAVRSRSPIHHGALRLQVIGSPPTEMEGDYWTDRDSKGELRFRKVSPKPCYAFSDAEELR